MFIDRNRSENKQTSQDTQTQDTQNRYTSPDFNIEKFLDGLDGLNGSSQWVDKDCVDEGSPNDVLKSRDDVASLEIDGLVFLSDDTSIDNKSVDLVDKKMKLAGNNIGIEAAYPNRSNVVNNITKIIEEKDVLEKFNISNSSNKSIVKKVTEESSQLQSTKLDSNKSGQKILNRLSVLATTKVALTANEREFSNESSDKVTDPVVEKITGSNRAETNLIEVIPETYMSDNSTVLRKIRDDTDNVGNKIEGNQTNQSEKLTELLRKVKNDADNNIGNPKDNPKNNAALSSNDRKDNGNDNGSDKKQKVVIKPRGRWLSKILSLLMFLLLVVLPWILIINYVLHIAHPRYVTTADVVVKQVSEANVSTGSGFSALLGVNNTSVEDAKYLMEYIMSNDMVKKLDKKFHFQDNYYLDGSDFIYELPENATQEELLEYFKKRVRINLDEKTYILTVRTEGFEPNYALKLNKEILQESEQFVNRISQEMGSDQLQFAQEQLDESEIRLNDVKEKLINYQNSNQVFDPQANAQMVSQLIGGLQSQLSNLKTEERQLLSYLNPEAPQVVSIRSQISSVEKQVSEEQTKLTSSTNAKLNRQSIQFEGIKAEVDFATELYKISLSSMEKARLEAYRKMKSLIVISSPYKAEEALYPRVNYIIWTSLVFLLIFYGFLRLIMAVIRDHRD